MKRPAFGITTILFFLFLLTACSPGFGSTNSATPTHAPVATPTHTTAVHVPYIDAGTCPAQLATTLNCYTPYSLRVAYGLQKLEERGFTGKGQTIVDIVSFGSPTLQQDIDTFDAQFGLPPITIQVLSPLGTVPFDPNNADMQGWAGETELDVQIIHAIAPDANIIVMTSPVSETEGTVGLPEFLKLEQYAVAHHLGQIFSQSYVASEATLADSKGRQLVQTYTDFYKQITTQQGWTVLSGSGDNGATDWADVAATKLAPTPTVNFPADVPWVTAVGGTTLTHTSTDVEERAWSGSGGGMSKFFAEPDFQRGMSNSVQQQLNGQRGVPDIAADANPATGMAFAIGGTWQQVGGTSASTPAWAGIIAVANQMAGHPLGFINAGLYKVAAGQNAQTDFRDVTIGTNSVNKQVQGFSAVAGWDAVTGWGAPHADQLLPDLITALQ